MLKKFTVGVAAAIALSLYGCASNGESALSEPPRNIEASSDDVTTEAAEGNTSYGESDPVEYGVNPLTGENGYNSDAEGKRPVAVMVNNLSAALPQYGIENADMIYELPVEGGITRLMAVYADYTSVGDVCSVRSCRYYYPIICLGMDAIYCHWGADQTIALETLNRTGIDHLDGGYETSLFFRDEERAKTYASEHTGYLKGSQLAGVIEQKGFRTDINEQNAGGAFNFTQEERVPSEMTADSVTLNFSQSYFSTFNYEPSTGEYLKYHSGNPHIDGKTGNQLAFDNVFVLKTNISSRNGYLMDVSLSSGTGYYFSKGGGESITWIKSAEDQPIRVYSSDGSELTVNVGESYIGIIGNEKIISVE